MFNIQQVMENGKIFEFVKTHWFGIVSVLVVCAAICCGIYACSDSTTVNIDAKRNRVVISAPIPFEHGK